MQYSSLPGATVTAIREKRLSDVEDFDPDMVILQIGTNDLADDQCTHETLISAITDVVDTLLYTYATSLSCKFCLDFRRQFQQNIRLASLHLTER